MKKPTAERGVAPKILANCSCTNSLPFCSAIGSRPLREEDPGHLGVSPAIFAVFFRHFPNMATLAVLAALGKSRGFSRFFALAIRGISVPVIFSKTRS